MKENPKKNRLSYIDDVRSLVIFLVVMLHSSVTYSGLGGWYIVENRSESLGAVSLAVFGLFNSFNQAWFMGIMFFFGGYFAREGLARKGTGTFMRDRLLRLGLPLIGFVFVINPLMEYFIAYPEKIQRMGSFPEIYFGSYLAKGLFLSSTGPLWFVETLLVFSLALAAVVGLRSWKAGAGPQPADRSAARTEPRRAPSVPGILLLIAATAIAAFTVRLFWPIGTDWMNLQFSFFSSYIVLFALGACGSTSGWFISLTSGRSSRWFVAALVIGIPFWAVTMILGGALTGSMTSLYGGLCWQSAAYAVWESFTAIAMSLGLTALFANRKESRKRRSGSDDCPGKVSRFFSRNSFSVYVFHPVFLIGLTKTFAGWSLPPLLKAAVVGFFAFALTLFFAELIVRRVPGIKKYF